MEKTMVKAREPLSFNTLSSRNPAKAVLNILAVSRKNCLTLMQTDIQFSFLQVKLVATDHPIFFNWSVESGMQEILVLMH
jgi:hypothetical protein